MSTTAYSCVGFRVTLSSEQHRDGIAYYYDTPTVYDMRRSDMPSTGVSSRRAHDGTHNDIVQKSTILDSLLHSTICSQPILFSTKYKYQKPKTCTRTT